MEMVAPYGAVLALAFLCESLTEYLFSDLLAGFGINARYLRYVAAAMGVMLCLIYSIDAVGAFLGISSRFAPLGQILTGLLLGRGANYVHDFYSRFVRSGTHG